MDSETTKGIGVCCGLERMAEREGLCREVMQLPPMMGHAE
jgi:hypothetical protein